MINIFCSLQLDKIVWWLPTKFFFSDVCITLYYAIMYAPRELKKKLRGIHLTFIGHK